MPGITITDLRFAYPASRFGLRVDGLEVRGGEGFALLGPSGAGKTTLLRLMTGILSPASGEVRLGDVPITKLSENARREFRLSQVGLIFQDFALLDYLTVEENVRLPMRFAGRKRSGQGFGQEVKARQGRGQEVKATAAAQRGPTDANDGRLTSSATSDDDYAVELAERLDIARHWKRLTSRLSQGERQRVAIARALAHRPRFVFADEPTASLDAARRQVVMDLLLDYTRQNGACLVMVTHDQDLMPLFSQSVRVEDFAISS